MFKNKLGLAAVLSTSVALASFGAASAEPNNTVGCLHLSKQVSQSLDANQQSQNFKAARDEQSTAKQYCMSGIYDKGVAHYAKALELLGTANGMSVAGTN